MNNGRFELSAQVTKEGNEFDKNFYFNNLSDYLQKNAKVPVTC